MNWLTFQTVEEILNDVYEAYECLTPEEGKIKKIYENQIKQLLTLQAAVLELDQLRDLLFAIIEAFDLDANKIRELVLKKQRGNNGFR